MTFYPLEFTPSILKFAQPEGQPFGLLGGWQAGVGYVGHTGCHHLDVFLTMRPNSVVSPEVCQIGYVWSIPAVVN
jgi:hypothetical protein